MNSLTSSPVTSSELKPTKKEKIYLSVPLNEKPKLTKASNNKRNSDTMIQSKSIYCIIFRFNEVLYAQSR